ncbi:MAG TPA: prolipoprotein diacylglyceryl transferase [Mesorhizobium sp.]
MIDYLLLPLAALPFPNINPVLVEFGPFFGFGPLKIHWYGVGYVVGILFGWWYAQRLLTNAKLWRDGKAPFGPELIDDLLVYAALGIVLGGRIGYILFYNLQHYLANPLEMLALQDGGMSFHGGFLGCTLAMILLARSRGVSVWSLFDVIAAGTPVALGLVRVTNFINQELWGAPTDMPWGVVFPNAGDSVPRHPSQIYEALLEGLVLFLVLRFLTHPLRKLRRPGFVAGAFVTGYGLARIFVEFFRLPDRQIGYLAGDWLTMGMVLSLPLLLVGLWAMATARPAGPHPSGT